MTSATAPAQALSRAAEHALAYAALGWHVLPLAPGQKTPLDGQGLKHATTNPDTIRRWFRRCPGAGIGIAMAPSGLCAVDIDPRNGGDLELRDRLPPTLTAATGGGGLHLVYRVPAGATVRASIGPGVDVKHRGYIAAEPSIHPSGKPYSWLDFEVLEGETPGIADAPPELLQAATPARVPTAEPGASIAEGGRNQALTREAGRLRRIGLSADAIEAALQQINTERCTPPLPEDEVRAIAGSVGRYDPATTDTPTAKPLMPPDFSDDALALDFVTAHGAAYRWSPGLGWMHDAGVCWRRDEGLSRYDLARRVCRAAAGCARGDAEQKRLTSAKTVAAVLSLAQSDQRIVVPASAWDADQLMLNTPAGIVDLTAGRLRPRRHDDYVTQATRVAPDFERGAETFDAFMLSLFGGDHELVDFMQRALGYCITGDRREQVLFFWHGSGSNGKSTLLDLVQWLLGDYVLKMPAAALMVTRNDRHPTELAQLRGKRVAIASELEEGQFWNEALIKELTGDEVLTARFMRQDFFEFSMTQKHIIVGNHKPRLRGSDPAIARRLVLVPFVVTFEGQRRDRRMLEKLKAEAPAILAWLVHGAVRWHREGLCIPERVRSAGAEYLAEHDDMALWMAERCTREGEAKAAELYASFRHWKESCGEHAPSMKVWAQRLQAVPGVVRRVSNGVRYAGLRLSDSELQRVRYGD